MKNLFVLLFLFTVLFSCNESNNTKSTGKLKIVTTTGMLADGIKNIVGEHAEVVALMGPGVDPHLYQPLNNDYQKLDQADIIIYNGLHLEGKMSDILEKLKRTKNVIAISDGINESELIHAEGFKTHDPHLWFNVGVWSIGLEYITNKIVEIDTINKTSYLKNWDVYQTKLKSLHQESEAKIKEIPENQRLLITAHDAFNYFGKAYGIQVKGLQGVSTIAQAGIKDVTHLVDLIIEKNIKAIFIETSIPKKQIGVVVENCEARGHNLKIGGTLYSDAMGAKDTEEGTYIGMVRYNVKTIVNALK